MRILDNLPAGAEHDSRAPWNTTDLCRYCDEDQLRDIAKDNAKDPEDDYEVDELLEKIKSQTGLCRHCHEEEVADFRDDD